MNLKAVVGVSFVFIGKLHFFLFLFRFLLFHALFATLCCFVSCTFFSLSILILKLSIEKSRTMEAIHNGNRIAVGRFSDTVNVAIHRSTSKAAWNVSTGEAIIGNWWHSDKSGAGALRKWKPIDLVRYVIATIAITDQVFFASHEQKHWKKEEHEKASILIEIRYFLFFSLSFSLCSFLCADWM